MLNFELATTPRKKLLKTCGSHHMFPGFVHPDGLWCGRSQGKLGVFTCRPHTNLGHQMLLLDSKPNGKRKKTSLKKCMNNWTTSTKKKIQTTWSLTNIAPWKWDGWMEDAPASFPFGFCGNTFQRRTVKKLRGGVSITIWVFPKIGVPQNGCFTMENPKTLFKWMIWGYPYFRKHPFGGQSQGNVGVNELLATNAAPLHVGMRKV